MEKSTRRSPLTKRYAHAETGSDGYWTRRQPGVVGTHYRKKPVYQSKACYTARGDVWALENDLSEIRKSCLRKETHVRPCRKARSLIRHARYLYEDHKCGVAAATAKHAEKIMKECRFRCR